jgi:hypothetical protein
LPDRQMDAKRHHRANFRALTLAERAKNTPFV